MSKVRGTDYIVNKTALGLGKARRRNTRPAKRLASKVERREGRKLVERNECGECGVDLAQELEHRPSCPYFDESFD